MGGLTEVEAQLISLSPWAQIFREPVLEFLLWRQVEVIHRSLTLTGEMAQGSGDQPQLVYNHVHSPHTPFVLHPPGLERPPQPACLPTLCSLWSTTIGERDEDIAEFGAAMEVHLQELNRLVLATLPRIIEADPGSIIVLMSDHGIRYSLEDLDEQYRILLAARTPNGEELFPDNESPVNVLRRILARLGEDVAPSSTNAGNPIGSGSSTWIARSDGLVPMRTQALAGFWTDAACGSSAMR